MTLLRNLAQRVRGPGATEPGSPGAGSAHELLDRHAAQLPENPQRVVLLADAASAGEVEDLLAVLPTARVAVISTAPSETWQGYGHDLETFTESTLDQINWRMRFLAGADLCIDMATRTPEEYGGLWHRLFLHLEPGAAYVIDRRHDPRTPVPDQLLDAAASQGLEPATLRASYSQPARRRAVASVFVDADCIIVRKRGHHLLKVRERLADRLLPAREPDLGVARLAEVPAQEVTCAATVVSHTSSRPMKWLDTTMKAPALFLRHYEGEIAMVSNGLLVSGTSILPDSFRHHVGGHLSNPVLIDSSGDHGQLRARDRAHTRLEGSYYHLDSENSGHYGHLLTEVVSRLWGWDEAKRRIPDLKAVFRIRYPDERDPVLEKRIFGAYGIAPEDITWTSEPVWVDSLVGATPMWHNQIPHYVHPAVLPVWDRIRASLLDGAEAPTAGFERSGGERIFVSRRDITENRACRNTREVESFFAERGFDVVYPEAHDLAEQAAIFDRAEVIAGFGGSAMFNIMFARDYRALILLNHEAYTARNEHLFTTLLGGEVHYFWSTPDIQQPETGWSKEAYYSPWSFDFERNAGDLTDVLASLR